MIVVTFSAGYLKIFSPDPRLGFLSGADKLEHDVATTATNVDFARQAVIWKINALVALAFLILVLAIVTGCAWQWWRLLRGTKPVVLHESEFVSLCAGAGGESLGKMREKEMLAVVAALANQPTAPFHEDAVRTEIEAQLRKISHVRFERDGFGNVIAHFHRGRKRAAAWALAAHMDHPGWVRGKDGEVRFLGSVAARFRSNPKKRSFGDFEMWDLPPFEIRDRQIHSRACDDLLGCAEIICVLREIEEQKANVHCIGLFTRAEEVGFVGAIKLAQAEILPRSLTILSLETSTPRGTAEIGRGPIVRVGDKVSSFDGPATARLLSGAGGEDSSATLPARWRDLRGDGVSALRLYLRGGQSRAWQLSQRHAGGNDRGGVCRD